MNIRKEAQQDLEHIYALNAAAFETDAEAELVDALRAQVDGVISLVAVEADRVVGHIMFSPVTSEYNTDAKLYGLAPMAVDPSLQKQSIGSALVKEGLKECKVQGVDAIVVLGHPNYYRRFGFKTAADFDIRCEYDVPAEVFMLLELNAGVLDDVTGMIRYHPVFAEVS